MLYRTKSIIFAACLALGLAVALSLPAVTQAPTPIPSVWLQAASPGTAQTGNIRINGKYTGAISQDGAAAITLTANGNAVNGMVVNATGTNATGVVANATGYGLYGTGDVAGVFGASSSGAGVIGSGSTYGMWGQVSGSASAGVYGEHFGAGYGVNGYSGSGTGVNGVGLQIGVRGNATSNGAGAAGVYGSSTGINGSAGVVGMVFNSSAYAVVGTNYSGIAVIGFSNAALGYGVAGQNPLGVGVNGSGTIGVAGSSSSSDGVRGTTSSGGAAGVSGVNTGGGTGVHGMGVLGVNGIGSTSDGVRGTTNSTNSAGVSGNASGSGIGVYAASGTGTGILSFSSMNAVHAVSSSTADSGVFGVNTSGSGWGVYSGGNFAATGGKAFQIDHPFDPANKYLMHYCSEGPEPLDVYSGSVTTDGAGNAIVALPDYFAEINKDPRIQLTVVDSSDDFVFTKVVHEVEGCQFAIRTSKPHTKVFWRVDAVRNDNWMKTHGFAAEQDKPEQYRGTYLNPEFFGQPATKQQWYLASRQQELGAKKNGRGK